MTTGDKSPRQGRQYKSERNATRGSQIDHWAIHFVNLWQWKFRLNGWDDIMLEDPAEISFQFMILLEQLQAGAIVPGYPGEFGSRTLPYPDLIFQHLDTVDFQARTDFYQSSCGFAVLRSDLATFGVRRDILRERPDYLFPDLYKWNRTMGGCSETVVWREDTGEAELADCISLFVSNATELTKVAIFVDTDMEAMRVQALLSARHHIFTWDRISKVSRPSRSSAERLLDSAFILCREDSAESEQCKIKGLEYFWQRPGVDMSILRHAAGRLSSALLEIVHIAVTYRLEVIPESGEVHVAAFEASTYPEYLDMDLNFIVDSAWAIRIGGKGQLAEYAFNLSMFAGC